MEKENKIIEVRLSDVLYVPKMNENLVSIRKLAEKGFNVEFTARACMLRREKDWMSVARILKSRKNQGGSFTELSTKNNKFLQTKIRKSNFSKRTKCTDETLDCIISSIYGPVPVRSVGKARYFATYMDIKSEYTKDRIEATKKFVEYIEKLKMQFRRKPKFIRTDRRQYINGHQ